MHPSRPERRYEVSLLVPRTESDIHTLRRVVFHLEAADANEARNRALEYFFRRLARASRVESIVEVETETVPGGKP